MQRPPELPPDIPDEALAYLQRVGYLDADPLRLGDPAPDAPLAYPGGRPETLHGFRRGRPLALVFGSYT